MHADFGALALFPASRRDTIALERRDRDDQAWAVYSTVDHRPEQVLVLTQSVDATRRTADDAVNDVEWIVREGKVEPPGSISTSE